MLTGMMPATLTGMIPARECAGFIAASSMMRIQWQSWWAWLVRCRPFTRMLLTWGALLPPKPPFYRLHNCRTFLLKQ